MANSKQITTSIIILIATVLLIFGAVYFTNSDKKLFPPNFSSSSAHASSSRQYKNGTYIATGSYYSPDGYQEIGITMTVSGDVVTSTSAQNKASGNSAAYEDMFISNYKVSVVGKKIGSLNGTVSGPSLTLAGFEDALSQIQNQAKV